MLINGVIELNFTLDSGASDVLIPADVVMTLLRTGTLRESDFLGYQDIRPGGWLYGSISDVPHSDVESRRPYDRERYRRGGGRERKPPAGTELSKQVQFLVGR